MAFSQTIADSPDQVYGNDPLLYNGKIYSFFPQTGTVGSQYLYNVFDNQGSVTLRGITYTNLSLNYDAYNQLVVLKYKNANGTPGLIEISGAWLEKFDLGGRHFEIVTAADTTKRIYQVFGNGTQKIMYYYRKELRIDTRTASKDHFFANPEIEKYVKIDKQLIRFKNNRGFIAAFSLPQQEQIKKYLRKHKIKVKKSNDYTTNELINYCNSLTGS